MIFLAVFILIPIIEIALFIKVGGTIGLGWTLLMCFFTAVLGAALIRIQGLSTVLSARRRIERNETPMVEMMDGIALVFAGACLITPGFFTDTVGFILLIPPLRHYIQQEIIRRFGAHVFAVGGSDFHNGGRQSPYHRYEEDDIVIDGEYERMDEDNKKDESRNKLDDNRDDTP